MCATMCCSMATWAGFSPDQRGQGFPCAAGAGPWRIPHAGGLRPALSPVLDGLDTAAHLPSDLHIPPGGLLMGEQKNPSALDFRIRGRVAGAEVVQMRLLLRRELDGILG